MERNDKLVSVTLTQRECRLLCSVFGNFLLTQTAAFEPGAEIPAKDREVVQELETITNKMVLAGMDDDLDLDGRRKIPESVH